MSGPEDDPDDAVNGDPDSTLGEDDESGFDEMADWPEDDDDEGDEEDDDLSDTPKMTAYMVAALFDSGALCLSGICAPSVEIATAKATVEFVRSVPPNSQITGICVVPLAPEFMREALRAIEGDEPARARSSVVSLVPPVQEDARDG